MVGIYALEFKIIILFQVSLIVIIQLEKYNISAYHYILEYHFAIFSKTVDQLGFQKMLSFFGYLVLFDSSKRNN